MIGLRTNTASLTGQRYLNGTLRSMQKNLAALTSGYRINSAADDAAGLAVSEDMKVDIRSLGQAERNASDTISVMQTAEGALGQVHNILGRLRELAVQANSDGINDTQRGHINKEFTSLISEIDDISSDTHFNGKNLLDGSFSGSFQVGIDASDSFSLSISQGFAAADLEDATGTNNLAAMDITSLANAATAMDVIDNAVSVVSGQRATLGANMNRIDRKIENLSSYRVNLEAAKSRIMDTDIAATMAELTKNQILSQAGVAMLAQANSLPQTALSLLGG